MGRHAPRPDAPRPETPRPGAARPDAGPPATGGHRAAARHGRRTTRPGPAAVGIAAATVLALAAAAWVVTRPRDDAAAAPAASSCRVDDTVRVSVVPEAGALVRRVLSGPIPLEGGGCTVAEVRTQEPLQTLAALSGGDVAAQPQVWVPDDASWGARAGAAVASDAGVLGQTSLVLATSRAVADARGWTATPPTWAQALDGPGVALADPLAGAAGLVALAAVQTALGPGDAADTAVARLVLGAGGGASPGAALADAVAGSTTAPVAVVTEREVAAATADGAGDLVVVVPAEGAPVLELPVLRTVAGTDDAAAVDAVLGRLTDAAREGRAVRAEGWRDADGRGPDDDAGPPAVLQLDAATLDALPDRVASLVTPSRLLTVVDVSTSMDAPAGGGTRATLARDALTSALSVLPDRTTGGLWVFAARLEGDRDWAEVLPMRPFGTVVDGRDQRDLLAEEFASLPDRLSAGGTGLYDTVLAAVRSAREGFDPATVNTVVLLTDGTDDDPTGPSEAELLATLAAEADPARPVQVVAVGLGPDADLSVLERIVGVTGGAAYSAQEADDLRDVLVEAVRSRP
ncbi:VWA domain-containing protein [Modestobacter sp. Leaf380]|uniref:VWA domain-containing protein n=1 Tax=Modestobacter sp. Leaf380 TaxID=1736356 RepID=UPI0006F432C7|nr:VWA domain-containing protein [Modestobacter sp. Leaf380]KQS68736.1 hypothetical protein ASG41_07410 [Modestobacter sp. Leaf380]